MREIKIIIGLILSVLISRRAVAQHFVVRDGQAKSAIVVQDGAGGLTSRAASELQKYMGRLTGAEPQIISPGKVATLPNDQVLLLVGGPGNNSLVKKAADAARIDFRNLKAEGFLLKTIQVEARPALVIGGNDEAGTLYGAYDWLERQGVVFQISGDIIPSHRDSLLLDDLDVRSEPAFSQRGFGIAACYEPRSIWSYPDLEKFIDQMAKLKLNYLIWHMFSHEPYLEYSYAGEKKQMGDVTSWQGGYTLPDHNFGSRAVGPDFVGKEVFDRFGKGYLAPDEWQGVQDQNQVYAAARDLLQRVIHYARMRNVKVWVALESLNQVSPSMARFCRKGGYPLPYGAFTATYVCPTDVTTQKINELRFKSFLASYPEAAGFIFWINEGFPACHHPEDEALFEKERSKYADARDRLIKTHIVNYDSAEAVIDNSIAAVYLIRQMLAFRDRISPTTNIAVGGWGRAFLLPTLDRVLPKDVQFVDNETSGMWTPKRVPMESFGGMGDRDRIFMHVGDNDTGMIGMQFHLRLYYHDGMLERALENGAQGVTEFGDRFRGEEHLARYMADGAWNPHLTPDQFYHHYARQIFGERAEGPMFNAFMALEDMEGYQGYHYQKPKHLLSNLVTCCSPPTELAIAKHYAEQANPYDGPTFKEWNPFIAIIPERVELLKSERALEEKALGYMKLAEAEAAPGSLNELHYLENKTEAYSQLIAAFIQLDQAFAECDQAFRVDPLSQRTEFLAKLDASFEDFEKARIMARESARTWADFIDNVSDLGVLWRLNTFVVTGTDLIARFMETISNYHHGKPYLTTVHWEKVFSPLPIIARAPEE